MIWLPKEVAHLGRRERDDACGVDMWHTLKLLRAPARVCVKKCFNPVQGGADVTNRDLPADLPQSYRQGNQLIPAGG